MRSIGAAVYILGMLVAGVMFIVIGTEYGDSNPDQDNLNAYFWVYAIAMILAGIGLVVDNGNRFCGEEETKGVDYFGGLFQICAVLAWGGFGFGLAFYYDDGGSGFSMPTADEERAALAWMSGVAAIFFGFGSLFMLKEILCCEGFKCNMMTIFEMVNMVLQLALIVFWFLLADRLDGANLTRSDMDTYAYIIGIIYILMALLGAFLFLDLCCGDDDDYKPKPKPYGYDDGYKNDSYNKPSYDDGYKPNPGYGDNKPSYGGGYDDTTTGYGSNPPKPQPTGY